MTYLQLVITDEVEDKLLDFVDVLRTMEREKVTEHHHLDIAKDRNSGVPWLKANHL